MYLIGSRHLMLVVDLREQKRHAMAVHTRILTGKGCKVGIAIATFVQKSLTTLMVCRGGFLFCKKNKILTIFMADNAIIVYISTDFGYKKSDGNIGYKSGRYIGPIKQICGL